MPVMSDDPRYAIYYTPAADSALARFGAEALGYDAFGGNDVAFPRAFTAHAPDWADLTADPRKYGFHATLKAPFSLASDRTEAELIAACIAFADRKRTLPIIVPSVEAISGFSAIVPRERSAALDALAQDCVETFDAFRAPMTAKDRARRHPERLTDRQVAQLDLYGYPFVRDDFRFHMTLTGRLPAHRRDPVIDLLRGRFATLSLTRLVIDSVALFRQDHADSRFQVMGRFEQRSSIL